MPFTSPDFAEPIRYDISLKSSDANVNAGIVVMYSSTEATVEETSSFVQLLMDILNAHPGIVLQSCTVEYIAFGSGTPTSE